MKSLRISMGATFALLCSFSSSAEGLDGWWSAKVAGTPISIHVNENASGPSAYLYSPTQTSDSIAVDVTGSSDTVRFSCAPLHAVFSGTRTAPSTLDGVFSQGGARFNITFTHTVTAPHAIRPQTPVEPFQYLSEEITLRRDTSTLAGTLTIPLTRKPAGAVVFVSGTGAQDRDETIMGHKPFAVIADWLTRGGWATLRCDDRGIGGSSAGEPDPTYSNLAADPLAQIRYLRTMPGMAGKPIGIIGHSQGGDIAFVAAAEHPNDVDFVIALAAPGVKGTDLMLRQNEMLIGDYLTPAMKTALTETFGLLATDSPSAEIEDRVRQQLAMTGIVAPQAIGQTAAIMLSHPFRTLLRHDPSPYMKRTECPVLAIGGDCDMQVDAAMSLPAIAEAIPHATTILKKGVNHLMQPSDEPTLDYYSEKTTISPDVLKQIYSFLLNLPSTGPKQNAK